MSQHRTLDQPWRVAALSSLAGSEITGLDATAPLSDEAFAELRGIWTRSNGLLVLRNQRLDEAQHLALARRFGPVFADPGQPPMALTNDPTIHPQWPQIVRVSNRRDLPRYRKIGTYWHSDFSYLARPASASLLLALEIPRLGGDTLFASTNAAYEALPPAMRATLEPLRALHRFAYPNAPGGGKGPLGSPPAHLRNLHPVVRRHPESGKLCLFVNPAYSATIDGLPEAEGKALLDRLFDHLVQPAFVYRHRWQPHDLLIWDNRCLNHYAVPNHAEDETRHLHRITVMGEPPLAANAAG